MLPAPLQWRLDRAVSEVRYYKNLGLKKTWEPCAKILVESRAGKPLREFLSEREKHAFPPGYSDLWSLYSIVRRLKPNYVLEYGAGASTVVLAEALRQNGKGYLRSVDAMQHWAAEARRALPKSLHEWCEIIYSELEISECYGQKVFRHQVKPERRPDMVYLDGPALTEEVQVAADLLDLEPQLHPGFVLVIDCRYENTAFLRKHLKRQYRFSGHPALDQPKFELLS